jgi:hypothetical protein
MVRDGLAGSNRLAVPLIWCSFARPCNRAIKEGRKGGPRLRTERFVMASLPGWDSIEGSNFWHDFFDLGGILLFLVVVVFEILSYFYGHRKDDLVAIAQRNTAVQAQQDQDALRRRLDEANKQVASLEAEQTPRHLRPDQKSALITALSPFHGQRIELWCSVSAFDCNAFAEEFREVFRLANWSLPPKIDFGTADYDVVGIEPLVNDGVLKLSADTAPIPAAIALANTLFDLGLIPKNAINRHPSVPLDTILIRIGRNSLVPGR